MIEINIPGRNSYLLKHLVLDLNGTIALDGEIIAGVGERLQLLGGLLGVLIVTADTHGNAQRLRESLKINVHKIDAGAEEAGKLQLVRRLGSQNVVAIGNGANDVAMLRESVLGICVLGQEGACTGALNNSDLVVTDINAALDLLLNPKRLVASLRR